MADAYLKRKEFSPKRVEYSASSKRRGEVKSEPIVLEDEYESNVRSARRRIAFNLNESNSDCEIFDETTHANDGNEPEVNNSMNFIFIYTQYFFYPQCNCLSVKYKQEVQVASEVAAGPEVRHGHIRVLKHILHLIVLRYRIFTV